MCEEECHIIFVAIVLNRIDDTSVDRNTTKPQPTFDPLIHL